MALWLAQPGPDENRHRAIRCANQLKYEPIQAIAKAKLGSIPMNVNATFTDGQVKNEIDNGQGVQNKTIAVHPDARSW